MSQISTEAVRALVNYLAIRGVERPECFQALGILVMFLRFFLAESELLAMLTAITFKMILLGAFDSAENSTVNFV